MRRNQKPNKQTRLGRYLEDAKKAFLDHLQALGLFGRINFMATTTAPIVTSQVATLLVLDLSGVSDPTDERVLDRIDTLWDLFDILSRINRSSEEDLRNLRAKILRLELFHASLRDAHLDVVAPSAAALNAATLKNDSGNSDKLDNSIKL